MTIVFCISATAPMLLFWLWPHSWFLDNKKDEVKEYHHVLSNSLAAELSQYHRQLTSNFEAVIGHIRHKDSRHVTEAILDGFDIRHLCVAEYETGKVLDSYQTNAPACPAQIPEERLTWMKSQLGDQRETVVVTPVTNTELNGNVIFSLYRKANRLFVGAVSTDYVISIGKRIRFGELGHAAIFDQAGKVFSHPNPQWEKNSKDLSKMPVHQRMMRNETGIEVFHSMVFGQEMVAGYTHVPNTGWIVMVSQPVLELESEVAAFKYTTFTIMAMGMGLAVLLAYLASKLFTVPLQQMIEAMKRIGNGELRAYEQIKQSLLQPTEFEDAKEAIKIMAMRLQENIDTISRHAYLDGITGLPNRECFKVLAQEQIESLHLSGARGAILFLDLDGFKQVNDVYGHRSGDDLLKGFADKIHLYCGNEMKRRAYGADNAVSILPARLGGDEFVVFLGNIRDVEMVVEFAEGLFKKVFGKFKLHNGINLQVSGSVGGALFPHHGSDFDELLRLADIAMYKAKNSGKGRFCLHQEGDELTIKPPQTVEGV
ncbi:MAG: diguanylate cyclase [Pseudomonadota bacterium]